MPDAFTDVPLDVSAYCRKGTTENRWYVCNQVNSLALSSAAISINLLYAFPLVVPVPIIVNGMAMDLQGTASGSTRFGLYADDGNVYPSSLLVDAGTFSNNSSGFNQLAVSLKLNPGLYWCACTSGTSAPSFMSVPIGGCMPILGQSNSGGGTVTGIGWSIARTFAALPATYPASGSVRSNAVAFAIYVRFIAGI